jgi:hypothetical protein
MLIIGSLAYIITFKAIPEIKILTLKAGLKGKDLNKKGTDKESIEVPESLGIAPATVKKIIKKKNIF